MINLSSNPNNPQTTDVMKVKVKVALSCPTLCDPMNYTVHEFSRSDYQSGEPFPSPRDLPNRGIKPRSPVLQVDSLPAEPQFHNISILVVHNLFGLQIPLKI